MKPYLRLWLIKVTLLVLLMVSTAFAQTGHYVITQLPISNALEPSINNSGEIVWALDGDQGIFSYTRGKLTDSGFFPHLANSGEVVYAAWFGGPFWDLVSTTRGRLTYGNIININASLFDVNTNGEVVYATTDTNNFLQIFSTVRGQITFDAAMHYDPCINDLGEIIWNQFSDGPQELVSSTRGVLPENYPNLFAFNYLGEICYGGQIEGPTPGYYTSPHIFSTTHGAVINDPLQYQWDGSMNDRGIMVWRQPDTNNADGHLAEAYWSTDDTNPPVITQITATPSNLWPPDNRMVPVTLTVNATDNYDPAPVSRIVSITSHGLQRLSDYKITGQLTVNLRATLLGKLNQTYTIVVACQDISGNISSNSVTVRVFPAMRRGNIVSW